MPGNGTIHFTKKNLSAFLESFETEHKPHSITIAAFAIFLSAISLILNGLILIIICKSADLRRRISYICVANISAVNTVLSLFVTPLAVHLELEPEWKLGQTSCAVWIIMDVLLPFVTISVLLFISADSLASLTCNKFYRKHYTRKKAAVYLIVPWVLAICGILPIWIAGAVSLPELDGKCIYGLKEGAAILSPLITYFIPSICIILIMAISLAIFLKQTDFEEDVGVTNTLKDQGTVADGKVMLEREIKHEVSTVRLFLANSMFIAMWFPHQFVSILLTYCDECFPPYVVIVGFTWLGAFTSFVVPLAFLDSQIRWEVKLRFWKLYKRSKNNDQQHEENESYLMESVTRTSV
ncbi:hypothetical protein FSP39_008361 [Pinctada imbricata]|uniref:G-protein coupled receptors family 1 profile domain-containing protein n=1 Tax=Pinctada imbricata TaxID=66713 RepID=A0AA89CBP8_PINIB|nr:hypothetical protein FSP39_008361 [Pinctada imbricata]